MEKGKGIKKDLFFTFMKIGAFTFGGGYAMISIIEDICVDRKQWITHDDMLNVTIIAESTPGPIAINCATFVGYQQAGLLGALSATLGVILPSFLIIFIISLFFDRFLEIRLIANGFKGIKAAVGILIWNGAVSMIKKMQKKALPMAIMAGSFGVMFFIHIFSWNFSTVSLMLLAGAVSLAMFILQEHIRGKEGK